MASHLRPIERRVLEMRQSGLSDAQIATRIKRSPTHVARIAEWATIPRSAPAPQRKGRALERRVLALRNDGETHEQIGRRFGRSPEFIRRVEGLAHYRRGLELLG